MGRMRMQSYAANPEQPLSGHYADAEVAAVLEGCVRAVLHAEVELRTANATLNRVLASCRAHSQNAQADAALKALFDRRYR